MVPSATTAIVARTTARLTGPSLRQPSSRHLAVAVLAGLLGNALLGWWWLDPIALAIAGLAIKEGRESWRGESCGCATC